MGYTICPAVECYAGPWPSKGDWYTVCNTVDEAMELLNADPVIIGL